MTAIQETTAMDVEVPEEEKDTGIDAFLEKLTTTITREFSAGISGDIARLKQAVDEFYALRANVQEHDEKGLSVLVAVIGIFTGSIQPSELKAQLEKTDDRMDGELERCGDHLLELLEQFDYENNVSIFIECASFLLLLSAICLVDYDEDKVEKCYQWVNRVWIVLKTSNRRSSDFVGAKICFYRVLFQTYLKERLVRENRLMESRESNQSMRTSLLEDYRTVILNHNEPCQVVITNLILQKYLEDTLITQAQKFISQTTFEDIQGRADPYQIARFDYYRGRINVIQLNYGVALESFKRALRKAPQDGAMGFKQIVTKYLIVTQLLMGEIPERLIFRQEGMINPLKPYFHLTQAVRVGDMNLFTETMDSHQTTFEKDGVYMLITRLRHNVIKAALRKISVSYSRIHLDDIARKLKLKTALEAEYIVAKAIKDGVIDAVIEHKSQVVRSTEVSSLYSTVEPQIQLNKRINYCMELHHQCLRSFQHKDELEEPEEKKVAEEQDGKTIEELVDEYLDDLEEEED